MADQLEAQDRQVIEEGTPLAFENTWATSGGRKLTFVATKFPLPGPDGEA